MARSRQEMRIEIPGPRGNIFDRSGQLLAMSVPAASVQNYLVTHEGVSDDAAYGVTKVLWTHLDALTAAHPAAKAIDLTRAIEGMPVPLHPGAEKYYKEVGLIK